MKKRIITVFMVVAICLTMSISLAYANDDPGPYLVKPSVTMGK